MHPGIGPITALATELFLGDPLRFTDGKAAASYIGMIPREHSNGGRQRLGAMSKQRNALLRYLWCEAAMHGATTGFTQFFLHQFTRSITRSSAVAEKGDRKTVVSVRGRQISPVVQQ